jgi:pimeloyl-ACP methyl ester carboxylesterase
MSNTITAVLVHGAFAESAAWNAVLAELETKGIAAFATPNPLRSVTSDAENVSRAIDSVGGPVLLVGHSYGGAVITEAASGNSNVVGLVYVAGFALEHGETSLSMTDKFPGSTLGGTVRSYPLGDGTNDLIIDRDLFPQQFAADVPLAETKLAAATQRAVRDLALSEPQPADTSAWKSLPSWFIFGSEDKNIPVEAHRFMADRANAQSIREIPGASHAIAVSQPRAVADAIALAVEHLS